MEYVIEGHHYTMSYKELRESYIEFCQKSDEDFMSNLPAALHLACVICFLKEIPTSICLSDRGIIHQLTHLAHIPDEPLINLKQIRAQFQSELLLAY